MSCRPDDARRDIDRMLMLFPANRFAVGAGIGRHHQQRLFAEFKTALQHFDDIAVGMFMHLIAQRTRRARTRLRLVG